MCGICGMVGFEEPPDIHAVGKMTERLLHRGPDLGAISSFPSCVLGHRRLSIIDLSEAAKQPMLSPDGKVGLVFNGEIYNFQEIRSRLESRGHTFRTRSDTEVLLISYLEYQDDMLAELNGMFSLAIWDDHRGRLLLARDRLGKKPLYYWSSGRSLSFSSELYSLTADERALGAIDEQALFEYLMYDFIPAPHTIFKGVRKLPAGYMAIFDKNGLNVRQYWRPPAPEESGSYADAKSELQELLSDAVKLRLISDVPLGAFLSGGIDSSVVTAYMKRHVSDKVKTFSIAFPGTSYDESRWSRLVSDYLGTDHEEHVVEYQVEENFPRMIRHFGEPYGDSSAIPTWYLCEVTRRHVTVALSGDGGDELFGGYERYLARRFQTYYDRLPSFLRDKIVEPFIERLPATTSYYGVSLSKKLKLFIDAARRMREERLAVVPRTFSRWEVADLTGIEYKEKADPVLDYARQWAGLDPVGRMMFTDLQTYMAEDVLTKVDRTSMAHSLEVRAPLLDYRIVEFACRAPLSFKLAGWTQKKILKDAANGLVPKKILTRSKYGFQAPLGGWFRGRLRKWAEERLLESDGGLVDKRATRNIWDDHIEGRADNAHKIWLLLVLNQWGKLYK